MFRSHWIQESVWTPQALNPDVYFDSINAKQSTNNEYADCTVFYRMATWKNQSQILNKSDAVQPVDTLQPMLRRQEVGGNNAVFFNSYFFTLNKYPEINYEFNDNFFIAFSFKTTSVLTEFLFDNRDSQGVKGMAVFIINGKLRFIFCDDTTVAFLGGTLSVEMDTPINDGSAHSVIIKSTTGTAAGVDFYLDGVLQPKTIIIDTQNTTTIKSLNPYVIGKTSFSTSAHSNFNASIGVLLMSRKNLIEQDILNFHNYCLRDNIWAPEKSSNNPIISGTVYDATQSYPPFVFEDNGTWYCYVGSTASKIVGFTSPNGIDTWTQQGLVYQAGAHDWEKIYVTDIFVRKVDSTYHMWYLANGDNIVNYVWGHATATNPLGPYTSDALPVLTNIDYNNALNRNMDSVLPSDVVKVNGIYYWFGVAEDYSRNEVFYATSTSLTGTITPQAILFKGLDASQDRCFIQQPRVFKVDWGWIMTFTLALQGENFQERNIRCAYCLDETPTNFTIIDEDVINPDVTIWEQQRVYGDYFLKKIDDDKFCDLITINGKYRQYYSGHSTQVFSPANQGLSGVAEYSSIPDLRKGRPVIFTKLNDNKVIKNILGLIGWFDFSENCYYDKNLLIWQVLDKINKNNSPTSPDNERPFYVAQGINNLPCMNCVGATHLNYGKALGSPASFTQFVVFQINDMSKDRFVSGGSDSAGTNSSTLNNLGIKSTGELFALISDGTNLTQTESAASTISLNIPILVTFSYTAGDNFIKLYKNGVLLPTHETLNQATSAVNLNAFSIGTAGKYYSHGFSGLISEFLFFDKNLRAEELDRISMYLINKYNITS